MEKIGFITVRQLSAQLNISVNTVRNWIRLKQVPYYKIIGKIKFYLPEIRNWLQAMKVLAEQRFEEKEKKGEENDLKEQGQEVQKVVEVSKVEEKKKESWGDLIRNHGNLSMKQMANG